MTARAGSPGTARSFVNFYEEAPVHHVPADCDQVHQPGDWTDRHTYTATEAQVAGILGWGARLQPDQWRAVRELAALIDGAGTTSDVEGAGNATKLPVPRSEGVAGVRGTPQDVSGATAGAEGVAA